MFRATILMLALLLLGCSRSLVYSPSLGLPVSPLKEKQIDLQAGAEMLPETRPEEIGGHYVTLGVSGRIAYGFSDRFSLAARGWTDFGDRQSSIRSGYALDGFWACNLGAARQMIILPRAGMLLNGNSIDAYGLSLAVVWQQAFGPNFSAYAGGGLAWGTHYFSRGRNSNGVEKTQMGFGLMGHAGVAWALIGRLRLNAELHPIYQINTFDETQQLLLAPHIGMGYTLR